MRPSGKNKRISREAIAARARVSPSTVSRALSDSPLLPETTRRRIKALALRLGYVPSHLGRSYYQGKSFRLGVVVPFSNRAVVSEYFSRMIYGMIAAAEKERYTVTVVADDGLPARDLATRVLSRSVDGLLFLNCHLKDRRFGELRGRGVPFVLLHHYVKNRPYLFLECDSEPGMRQAFVHLRDRGVRTVAYVAGNRQSVDALDRLALYRRFVRVFGFKSVRIVQGDYSRTSGQRAAGDILAGPVPQAVLCANDRMAFGLLEKLKERGVRVPEEMRIVGFDDQSVCTLISQKLTTIENPFEEIGRRAVRKLIEAIRGKPVLGERVSSRLIVRESA